MAVGTQMPQSPATGTETDGDSYLIPKCRRKWWYYLQVLLHNLQSLTWRVQSCWQLSDDKAKVLWHRGRNEVVTQERHKCSLPEAQSNMWELRLTLLRMGEGKGENVSIHISEAQLLEANPDKRHSCPTAGNNSKVRLWGSRRELSITWQNMSTLVTAVVLYIQLCIWYRKILNKGRISRPHNSLYVLVYRGVVPLLPGHSSLPAQTHQFPGAPGNVPAILGDGLSFQKLP